MAKVETEAPEDSRAERPGKPDGMRKLRRPGSSARAGTSRLSIRDEAKPFVLIAAVVVGIIANRLANGRLTDLSWISNVGLFAVMFAIMAFVEIKDVTVAFHKVRPRAQGDRGARCRGSRAAAFPRLADDPRQRSRRRAGR